MREKICDFIYLNTKAYISLSSLKLFYWATLVIPFMVVVIGVVGKSIFSLVAIAAWSCFYWIFVLILQNKYVKKTFELRFLVNGIMVVFVSLLFWILYISFNIVSDTPFLEGDFFLWMLFFYLLFVVIYILIIILGVHMGIYGKIREKSQSGIVIVITGFFAEMIPSAGVHGMHTSRALRAHASVSVQNTVAIIGFVFLIFSIGLGYINFVQYYYCIKYGITCDENGDSTSPMLEYKPKEVRCGVKKTRKKHSLVFRIFVGIISLFLLIFSVLLVIGIIINI